MNKEKFKVEQPIVYQILSNALKNDTLAHAYLFSGPKGTPKRDAALLLAQSIMCSHQDEDGFACQKCDECQRIAHEESVDFFWHHYIGFEYKQINPFEPEKKSKHHLEERIKKKDIVALQDYFESTSAEKKNRRVYILEDYDQATPDASNSLLKFLEEPQPGIYGILIADEKSNVLPTIQSRCQNINFRPVPVKERILEFEKVVDENAASMLVYSGYTFDQVKEWIQEDTFTMIQKAALDYTSHWSEMNAIVQMQTQVFPSKGKNTTRQWVRLWIEWLLYLIKSNQISLSLKKKVKMQLLLVENIDILRSPVDLALFLDRLYDEIRKVVIE